ncbi:TonB-dependent receptor [Sphingobium cloacae]|nr:TonB-dependent receptor [Sphingobium cloacae]
MRKRVLICTAAVVGIASTSARAQEDPAKAAPVRDTGEIVVTARRVSESLSKVPVAVSALSSEQLAARVVLSDSDLQKNFSGLIVRTAQTNNAVNFAIRGQSIDIYTGSQPGVLPYFNDVQISSFNSSGYYDLGNIQVLKGPQGTLFGRNATGGAVLFNSAKPTDKFEGFLTGRLGNYSRRQIQGAINVPIVDDKVLLRVAGDLERRDGYQYNVYKHVNEGAVDRESGRVSLTLRPTERLTNETVFQYSRARGTNVQIEAFSAYACGTPGVSSTVACLYSPSFLNQFPGGYAAYQALHPGSEAMPNGYIDQIAFQKVLGPWKVNTYAPSVHRGKDIVLTNSTAFELTDDVTIKNIFGFARTKTFDLYDGVNGGPFTLQSLDSSMASTAQPAYTGEYKGLSTKVRSISEELQVIGSIGSLSYIVGGYYSKERKSSSSPIAYLEIAPFGQYLGYPAGYQQSVQMNDFGTADISKALYGQLTQDFSSIGLEGLKLTGGFRYTWEKFSLTQGELATSRLYTNAAVNPSVIFETTSFSKPSWNVTVDYQVTHSLLVYFAQRGSWRAGGVNGQGPARYFYASEGGNRFKPETTYDFELGMKFKGDVGMIPVRANLALYNQIVKDVQRVIYATAPAAFAVGGVSSLLALTVNIPKARVRGFEFDLALNPTNWLEIGGTLVHTDAEFLNGKTTLFGQEAIYGTYADTPRWSGSVYGAVTVGLPNDLGALSLRGDLYAQTGQWFSSQGTTVAPDTYLPSYKLVNARLEWKDIVGSPMSWALFVKNLTNQGYYTGGNALVPFGTNGAVPGEPRMYGFEATVRF